MSPAADPVHRPFSGSYPPEDVDFLLRRVALDATPVDVKERAIQAGRHYGEMLSAEVAPPADYQALYDAALSANGDRLAVDLARLTRALATHPAPRLVLVSLARAGTPIGVLLRRGLAALGRASVHYSVSVFRDRGLDPAAWAYITARHPAEHVVFVDGWTAKGGIAAELDRTVGSRRPPLVVVCDLAGRAELAATDEDYLVPSAVLNATVSGLISRTVLPPPDAPPGTLHGCVHLTALAASDVSEAFVDTVGAALVDSLDAPAARWTDQDRARARARRLPTLGPASLVKPGVGEATRVFLRRVPEHLWVRDPDAPDVRHLVHLARRRGVPVSTRADLDWAACAVIAHQIPPV